jgi:hypothetical protein
MAPPLPARGPNILDRSVFSRPWPPGGDGVPRIRQDGPVRRFPPLAWAPLLGLLVAPGCTRLRSDAIAVGADELAVAAVVRGTRIVRAGRLRSGSVAPVVEAGPDDRVLVWVLPREVFVGLDELPIDDATLEQLEFAPSTAALPDGSCGICTITATVGAPQTLLAGDRCPLPLTHPRVRAHTVASAGAAVALSEGDLDEIRRALRVDVAGPCQGCVPPPPVTRKVDLEMLPLHPAVGAVRYDAGGVSPAGDVLVAGLEFGAWVPRGAHAEPECGRRVRSSMFSASALIHLPNPERLFFLAAGPRSRNGSNPSVIGWVEPSGPDPLGAAREQAGDWRDVYAEIDITGALQLADRRTVLMWGRQTSEILVQPLIVRCWADPVPVCAPESIEPVERPPNIRHAIELDDGPGARVLAVDDALRQYVGLPGGSWRTERDQPGLAAAASAGGRFRPETILALGRSGSHVLACVRSELTDGDFYSLLLRASVPPRDAPVVERLEFEPLPAPVAMSEDGWFRGWCRGFAPRPEGETLFMNASAWAFRPGPVAWVDTSTTMALPQPDVISQVHRSIPGIALARTFSGAYLRVPESGPVELAAGAPRDPRGRAVAWLGGAFWAFSPIAAPLRIDPEDDEGGCGSPSPRPVDIPGRPVLASEPLRWAAPDPVGSAIWLAGGASTPRLWRIAIDRDCGPGADCGFVEVPPPQGAGWALVAGAVLDAETLVVAVHRAGAGPEGTALYARVRDAWQLVSTPPLGSPPTRAELDADVRGWSALAPGVLGVWAGGFGRLGLLRRQGDRVRWVEQDWVTPAGPLESPGRIRQRPPHFSAIEETCPLGLEVGASDNEFTELNAVDTLLTAFRVVPGEEGLRLVERKAVSDLANKGFDAAALGMHALDAGLLVLSRGGDVALLSRNLPASPREDTLIATRRRVSMVLALSASNGRDAALIAGDFDRLHLVRVVPVER